MKNIVGQIASKEDFYPRNKEIAIIIRNLQAGTHIQLTAPRRVGKSSILYFLKDNPVENFHFVYLDVESARTEQEFYRKIYKEILRSEVLTTGKKIWEQIKDGSSNFLKRLKNIKLPAAGVIELNEDTEVDYEEELLNFLTGIDLGGSTLVIMVDEFPEVILNILEDNSGEIKKARKFLQSNRSLRHNDSLRGKVQFIYTGSVSLNMTAAGLGSTELINDIVAIPVRPLTAGEAADFAKQVLGSYGLSIDQDQLEHLITKIQYHTPFYIQLVIQEILNRVEPGTPITNDVIDSSFEDVTNRRNDHYFVHYVKRLSRIFSATQLDFVRLVLNALATKEEMSRDEISNIGHDIISEEQTRHLVSSLIFDGYIEETSRNSHNYRFTSPILKNWWYNHEC